MLRRLWADHRNACLLSLVFLFIGLAVNPYSWVFLAAVLPIGWVLLKRNQSEETKHDGDSLLTPQEKVLKYDEIGYPYIEEAKTDLALGDALNEWFDKVFLKALYLGQEYCNQQAKGWDSPSINSEYFLFLINKEIDERTVMFEKVLNNCRNTRDDYAGHFKSWSIIDLLKYFTEGRIEYWDENYKELNKEKQLIVEDNDGYIRISSDYKIELDEANQYAIKIAEGLQKVWTLNEEQANSICNMINDARPRVKDESELISTIEEDYDTIAEQKEQLAVAYRLLPEKEDSSFYDLFATKAFEEDESEELKSDDLSISHYEIAEHMIARDRKKLVYSYDEGSYNTPEVDGVEMPVYSQLCWDVSNTNEFKEGGKKCGFTLIPTAGHKCDIHWDYSSCDNKKATFVVNTLIVINDTITGSECHRGSSTKEVGSFEAQLSDNWINNLIAFSESNSQVFEKFQQFFHDDGAEIESSINDILGHPRFDDHDGLAEIDTIHMWNSGDELEALCNLLGESKSYILGILFQFDGFVIDMVHEPTDVADACKKLRSGDIDSEEFDQDIFEMGFEFEVECHMLFNANLDSEYLESELASHINPEEEEKLTILCKNLINSLPFT